MVKSSTQMQMIMFSMLIFSSEVSFALVFSHELAWAASRTMQWSSHSFIFLRSALGSREITS